MLERIQGQPGAEEILELWSEVMAEVRAFAEGWAPPPKTKIWSVEDGRGGLGLRHLEIGHYRASRGGANSKPLELGE